MKNYKWKEDRMRTQEEIVKRINERKKNDMFGWEINGYIKRLDYEHAKPFLKKGVKDKDWKPEKINPAEEIKDYMHFAWEKANDCRGISAGRSLSHMVAWLWLDGRDYFLKEWHNLDDYEYYGKPQLIAICDLYGIDWKQYDDGVRTNTG